MIWLLLLMVSFDTQFQALQIPFASQELCETAKVEITAHYEELRGDKFRSKYFYYVAPGSALCVRSE